MGHTRSMARTHDTIDEALQKWIAAQHVFFVATAPTAVDGHVNVSPKGYDTFRVLDDTTVAYLDLTGSGVETIAHLRDNGRLTIMFCGFEGPPRIVRLFGRGDVVRPGDDGYDALVARFDPVGDPGGDPLSGRPHPELLRLRRALPGLRIRSGRAGRLG